MTGKSQKTGYPNPDRFCFLRRPGAAPRFLLSPGVGNNGRRFPGEGADVANSNPMSNLPLGFVLLVMSLGTLLGAIFGYPWPVKEVVPAFEPTAHIIGDAFLGPYLLPFEVAGILLLAALIAAVVVARKEVKDLDADADAAGEA